MTKGIYIGGTPITDARIGGAKLSAVYVGATKVWPAAPQAPVQIILTSGTSWAVPANWNDADNTIECIGAGATNGGGGAYARKNNLALVAGANVAYHIGVPSTTHSAPDTWFDSVSTVKAAGSIGSQGGASSSCVGDVVYSGGARIGTSEKGGGGAAGPNGDGNSNASATGGSGDAGYGGAGGASGAAGGEAGAAGTEWGTAGSGGGGGGSTSSTRNRGGNGGSFGGGGGGSWNAYGSIGIGAPGVIVITYAPV